ncbi:MAG: type II toxin-antitoxin system VapC family toxin [Defluviitaleaceae bacterium]|nr:type II toxin-antitoxin system VapC family toxin [Defluviitaleaceae bacterium]
MKTLDTNVILRFLLRDDEVQSEKSSDIIQNNDIFIPNEVFVETIYVLSNVYKFPKAEIDNILQALLNEENVVFQNKDIIETAASTYISKNLDIVDCMLFAYKKCEGQEIETFDKALNKLLNSLDV